MTATSTLTPTPTRAKSETTKRLWKTGAVAGVSAAAATTAAAALAQAADVSLKVAGKAIPPAGFAQLTLVASVIGTVLAVVLSRRATRPRHTFVVTTLVLTALSIIPDVSAQAAISTRVVLALTHVVAAVIVIPALASRLSD
jgi:Family of unknown function (DUF6069)